MILLFTDYHYYSNKAEKLSVESRRNDSDWISLTKKCYSDAAAVAFILLLSLLSFLLFALLRLVLILMEHFV